MGPLSRFFSPSFNNSARYAPIPISFHLIQSRLLSSPATHLASSGTSGPVLDYLKQIGFSDAQLEKMIKRVPKLLGAGLDRTIKPKIQLFIDSGFSPLDTAQIIAGDPRILTSRSVATISHSIVILKRVMGSDPLVAKALKVCSWFLQRDLENTLVPNVELLISRGVSRCQIAAGIANYARFFLYPPTAMMEYVRRVDEIGFHGSSGMFFHAIRTMGSLSVDKSFESKLEMFRSLGFSKHDALRVFMRSPQVFALSHTRIKEAVDFFLGQEGKADIALIIKHPSLLLMSLQRRVKPRLTLIDALVSRNLLPGRPSLTCILKPTDHNFFVKYVLPHSDIVPELHMLMTVPA